MKHVSKPKSRVFIKVIERLINSWIFNVETEEEFYYSYEALGQWLNLDEVTSTFSETLMKAVKKFLVCLEVDHVFWAYHAKFYVRNYGVVTTSISESLHRKIKHGPKPRIEENFIEIRVLY